MVSSSHRPWTLIRTSDGVKARRPFLILDEFICDGREMTRIVPVQSAKGLPNVGWTLIPSIRPVIEVPSVITLEISMLNSGNALLRGGGTVALPADVARAFIDKLRVTLGMSPRSSVRSDYTWHLNPPSIRAEGGVERANDLAMLKDFGWLPAVQGTIYEIPDSSVRAAEWRYLLAVSSDTFNTRFRYADALFVPISSNDGGRPVVLKEVMAQGVPQDLHAHPSALHTIRFRSDWFDKCETCARAGGGYAHWKVAGANAPPNCLSCHGTAVHKHFRDESLWPRPVATVTAGFLDQVVTEAVSPLERSLLPGGGRVP
jgi:hypothetical protein